MNTSDPTLVPDARSSDPLVTDAPGRPFLRFYHSEDLRTRTNDVLAAIECDGHEPKHAEALANIVADLTGAGLTYFFTEPLKAAKVGFLVEQTASFGLSSALTVMSPVIRNVISRMNQEQLLVVAAHLRQFIR